MGVGYYGLTTARLYRDRRYANIWLVGAGPALALSGELYESLKAWIGEVNGVHEQMLKCMLFQSGLDAGDLVAV